MDSQNNFCDECTDTFVGDGNIQNTIETRLILPRLFLLLKSNKPKLVIKNILSETIENVFDFDTDVVCFYANESIILVYTSNDEIFAHHFEKKSSIRLISVNTQSMKILNIINEDNNLLFVNSKRECYGLSSECKQALTDFDRSEVQLSLLKLNKRVDHILYNTGSIIGNSDLCASVGDDKKSIDLTCLHQSTKRSIKCNFEVSNIGTYVDNNQVLICNSNDLYLVDLAKSSVKFKISNILNCKPVGGYRNVFFYLSLSSNNIYLHKVEEKEPLSYAETLASHGNFDEAQEYGAKHGLSLENVYKLKVEHLIKKSLESQTTDFIEELTTAFNKISDFVFLFESCHKLLIHNVKFITLLEVINKRLVIANDPILKYKVEDTLCKVQIKEYLQLSTTKTVYASHSLVEILNGNILEICQTFLSEGLFELATVCWTKYVKYMKYDDFTSDVFVSLLCAPKLNIKFNSLLVWLYNFVPSVLSIKPHLTDCVVKWALDEICQLEKSKYWPEIGIKFAKEILTVVEKSKKLVHVLPPCLDSMNVIMLHLMNIKELKEKYRVNMLIAEFTRQGPNEICKLILHRAFSEDFRSVITNFLPMYMIQKGVEHDILLRQYVDELLDNSVVDEAKLNIIIKSFYSLEHKMNCVLHVLKFVTIPWSDTILNMAEEMGKADHHIAENIQLEIKYAKLRMVLKKYNYPDTWTDYYHVIQKIMSFNNPELQDANVVISVCCRVAEYSNLLYVDKCLIQNDVAKAIEFIAPMEEAQKKLIIKSIASKYEYVLLSAKSDKSKERNYLDFLKRFPLCTELKFLENLYFLKNIYNIKMSLNKYCSPKERKAVFELWCGECLSTAECASHYQRSLNLAKILMLDTKQALEIVMKVIPVECYLNLFTVICPSTGEFPFQLLLENSNWLSLFRDEKNSTILDSIIDILVHYLQVEKDENLSSCLEILSTLNSLRRSNNIVKNASSAWKLQYIFSPVSSLTSMGTLISYYEKGHFNCKDENLITGLVNEIIQLLQNTKDDLIILVILIKLSQNFITLEMEVPEQITLLKHNVVKRFAPKILQAKCSDNLLFTSLLCLLPTPETWLMQTMDSYAIEDAENRYTLSTYMLKSSNLFSERKLSPQYNSYLRRMCQVKYNLEDPGLSGLMGDEFDETVDLRSTILKVFMERAQLDEEEVFEICKTANLNPDDGLTMYLLLKIVKWDTSFIVSTVNGAQRVIMQDAGHSLLRECEKIMDSIEDKSFLKDGLNQLWNNGQFNIHNRMLAMNPYYYEVYHCIYRLLISINSNFKSRREYLLLLFLENYHRCNPPKQQELEFCTVKGYFPNIGYHRLPFKHFQVEEMWSNLKFEITLTTYERWLPVAGLLNLNANLQMSRDMLCGYAVKQTMAMNRTSNESRDEGWKLFVTSEKLLRRAHDCVQFISSMEWAGACLFHVLQGSKRGADQVAAAKVCYQFAQKCSQLQPDNDTAKKLQKKYAVLSTIHVLHKINCAKENFLKLSSEPANLIQALYMDQNIPKSIELSHVNKAIDEIADKAGVNISTIRMHLLEYLLDHRSRTSSKDVQSLDKINLLRACFILKATPLLTGPVYLAQIGLDSENDYNKLKKLRALQCLIGLADGDILQKNFNMSLESLWIMIMNIFFSLELERLEMPYVVNLLAEDKDKAIAQIWHSSDQSKDAVGVIIRLCLCYRLRKHEIFEQLIEHMLRCDMMSELIEFLPNIDVLQNGEVFLNAWQCILITPFEKADLPLMERHLNDCVRSVGLLHLCPVVGNVNLEAIFDNCIRLKRPDIGCLVFPFVCAEDRDRLWLKVQSKSKTLISKVKDLYTVSNYTGATVSILESYSNS